MKKIYNTIVEALNGTEKDYTSGNINRAIILLAIPMILEMVLESFFAIADAFFVAKIGKEAVATIGLTESFVTLIYSIGIGLSMAATAMIARRIGEKKPEDASKLALQAIIITTVVGIFISIFGIIFGADILRWMGGSESLVASGTSYIQIVLGGNIAIMLLFLLNGIFRGAGDASLAMRSLWLANGLNIILDPLLIFGIGPFPEMGLKGAAIATTTGRSIGVLYQLYILFNGKSIIKITFANIKIQWSIIKQILRVAAGGAGQHLIGSASWIFMMRIIAEFGDEVLSGYTIAIRIIIFTLLPAWGISNAAATLVGQNLGAGKPDRAEVSVWRTAIVNIIFILIVSVILFTIAPQAIAIFMQDTAVINAGVLCLRIFCITYVAFAFGMVVSQAFNGAGDTKTPTLVNLFCFWIIEIPLAYTLALTLDWGPSGVYWAIGIAEFLLASIFFILFRKGNWKLVKV